MIYRFFLALLGLLIICCDENAEPRTTTDSSTDSDSDSDSQSDNSIDTDSQSHGMDIPALPGTPWNGCLPSNYPPTDATVVTAFDLVDQYNGDDPNRRQVETVVNFPETGNWQRIDMMLNLDCPEDNICDYWDRFANLVLVENPGEEEEILELERYITPYGVPMCILTDVSRFGPSLKGSKTLRSFIDTWVDPSSTQGHGWRTSVKFIFHPGETSINVPDTLIQLWPYSSIVIGDPENPIEKQLNMKTTTIPEGVSKVELRVLVTGHGQGNALNCAEFCHTEHVVLVNEDAFSYHPWREDCAENPLDYQLGSWQYPRDGWCPGAHVMARVFDITSAAKPGEESTFQYQIWSAEKTTYENTCRPGAGDETNKCTGCVFNKNPGNCDYNSTNHTVPNEKISVQLLIYE